jgi:hypothetical protein
VGGIGATGPSGISNYTIATSGNFSNHANSYSEGTESRPAGDSVLGGGAIGTGGNQQSIQSSYPETASTWAAKPRYTSCRSPKTYTRLAAGSYVFDVRPLAPGGAVITPASRRFTVR